MGKNNSKINKWVYYKIKKPIESAILCIRFPFLYPRNRFTGRYYNNWRLLDFKTSLYKKYNKFLAEEDAYNDELAKDPNVWYLKKIGTKGWCEYWLNPWAKPTIALINFIHNYVLQIVFGFPTFTELDALKSEAPGWYKAFGIQLCKELRKTLIKDKYLFKFRITQWKEKYGRMELYCEGASKEVYDVIDKYSAISEDTCTYCGKPAVYRTTPYAWELPYCKECYEKKGGNVMIAFIKDKDNNWIENPEYKQL